MSKSSHLLLQSLLTIIVLLIITASRTVLLNTLEFGIDEARMILRTFGTPTDIIAWQPSDWPPLYNLTLGVWASLVGIHPVVLRLLSVLFMLLAAAWSYRLAYTLFKNRWAAWGTLLVYSGLGYSVYLSTFVRSYAVVLALFPLALWLTICYFERPTRSYAILLGLTLAAMFYSTYSAFYAFVIIGLYTLFMYRHQIWQWWWPGLIAFVLVLPQMITQLQSLFIYADTVRALKDEVISVEAILTIYRQYAGNAALIWFILLGIAVILWVVKRHSSHILLVWILLWVFVGPPIVYGTGQVFLRTRYTWWVLLGLALIIGSGLAHLPRLGQYLALGFMLVGMFWVPILEYQNDIRPPYEVTFAALRDFAQPGDVLVFDSKVYTGNPEQRIYYLHAYFGNKLPVVEDASGYRRVWYLYTDSPGWYDGQTQKKIARNRMPSWFAGPWNFLVRLYEAPPDVTGISFDNGLRFHRFSLPPNIRRAHDR